MSELIEAALLLQIRRGKASLVPCDMLIERRASGRAGRK